MRFQLCLVTLNAQTWEIKPFLWGNNKQFYLSEVAKVFYDQDYSNIQHSIMFWVKFVCSLLIFLTGI